MANHPHYRSQFGDTTYTKVFVGGLAWETPTEVMRTYFEQFGDILEAVIITDKLTGKSKGYGFVTFRDPESAQKACVEPNPVIDGRKANCNIASLGRPRPSPPRGRPQGSGPYHAGGAPSYGGGNAGPLRPRPPPPPPPLPPPPPMIYSPYGYPSYTNEYGFTQGLYNPIQQAQYYHQMYGASSSSSTLASPYYYGYSLQPPAPRGSYSSPTAHRIPAPPYLYYPAHVDQSSFPTYPPSTLQPIRHPFYSSSTDPQASQPSTNETDAGAPASERSST